VKGEFATRAAGAVSPYQRSAQCADNTLTGGLEGARWESAASVGEWCRRSVALGRVRVGGGAGAPVLQGPVAGPHHSLPIWRPRSAPACSWRVIQDRSRPMICAASRTVIIGSPASTTGRARGHRRREPARESNGERIVLGQHVRHPGDPDPDLGRIRGPCTQAHPAAGTSGVVLAPFARSPHTNAAASATRSIISFISASTSCSGSGRPRSAGPRR